MDPTPHYMKVPPGGWNAGDPTPHRVASQSRSSQSYYGYMDAGIGGLDIFANGNLPITNLVANYNVYHGTEGVYTQQLTLLAPGANQVGDDLLYAPSTRPPNGGCIEGGQAYYNGGQYTGYNTHAYIFAFDFCGGSGKSFHPDTSSTWFNTYVRTDKDGPYYTIQLWNGAGPNVWQQRYYNYTTNQFDLFYQTTGNFTTDGLDGWAQFETKYNVQAGTTAQCSPNLPNIQETSIRFYNGSQTIWLTPSNSSLDQPTPGETSYGSYGTCFNTNITPASYAFSLPYGKYDTWRVTSTGY